jgi:hypothetical protein
MKNGRTEIKMTIKAHKKDEKDANRPDSKPEKLAKLLYRGIVRYIKAKNARDRGENYGKRLDFSGERRVNRNH